MSYGICNIIYLTVHILYMCYTDVIISIGHILKIGIKGLICFYF